MKADKIREMDDRELKSQVKEIREQLFRLRFQMSMGQADGLKKYRELRKDQARIQGLLRERELKAAAGQRS
jgi:large subunit ribosomal protein L29